MRIKGLVRLSSTPIPKGLMAGLVFILGILVYGLVLLHRDQEAFLVWIREDGLAEWLTFAELLIMTIYSCIVSRVLSRSQQESAPRRVWVFLAFMFLFGAMEEISWGQRILGIESPGWFLKHNAQGEINVHNLLICGVKLNKLVFGKILAILVAIYLIVVPVGYRLSTKFKGFINRLCIPIAQNYQVFLCAIVVLVLQPHLRLTEKAGELRELSICFVFLLILLHPYNHELFPLKWSASWRRSAFFAHQGGSRT